MLKLLPGTDMVVEHTGTGVPRVVALHGWARTHADWAPVLADISAVALDLPGFGSEPAPAQQWGTPNYADQVLPAVRALDRPVLLGHSFGGRVAVRIAAAHPNLVSGVVLTGVPLLPRADSGAKAKAALPYRLIRRLVKLRVLPESTLVKARKRYGSADYNALSGVMRDTFVRVVNESYDDDLHALAAAGLPVSLVWGGRDAEVPLEVARRVHERLPGSRLVVLESSGHLLDADLVAALRTALAAHLAESGA